MLDFLDIGRENALNSLSDSSKQKRAVNSEDWIWIGI